MPDKQGIFVAAFARSMEDTRPAFEQAAEKAEGSEQALYAMANTYTRLISAPPERLLMQMQGYVLVAAAQAQGDDRIGELVRAGWMRLRETVRLPLGAEADEATAFLAHGMLINALAARGRIGRRACSKGDASAHA